jgi:integral membrane sensor domain MASE1
MTRFPGQRLLATLGFRGLSEHALELLVVGGVYFVLAKAYPATVPVWPAAGFAVGTFVLRGLRIWPAILVARPALAHPTTAHRQQNAAVFDAGLKLWQAP